MFPAISRNGTLFVFITAPDENVSSIHGPPSRCLTRAGCMKSQSCVHKFNIFFPFCGITKAYLADSSVCVSIQNYSPLRPPNSLDVIGVEDKDVWVKRPFLLFTHFGLAQKQMPRQQIVCLCVSLSNASCNREIFFQKCFADKQEVYHFQR